MDIDALVDRARALARTERALLGICGAPGSGKSTLAGLLVERLGPEAVVVPMDGFHLDDEQVARLGLAERKGAPSTFDVDGYLTLLGRLRQDDRTVYAPRFDRSHEVARAAAIAVLPGHRLVVTEGNYLLYDAPGWSEVAGLLDEVWFVEADERTRVERLVERHSAHGRSVDLARRWATGSDQDNADLVARTRERADLVIGAD